VHSRDANSRFTILTVVEMPVKIGPEMVDRDSSFHFFGPPPTLICTPQAAHDRADKCAMAAAATAAGKLD
jgi:hypothetical protein